MQPEYIKIVCRYIRACAIACLDRRERDGMRTMEARYSGLKAFFAACCREGGSGAIARQLYVRQSPSRKPPRVSREARQ